MEFGDGGGSGDRMPGIVFVERVAGDGCSLWSTPACSDIFLLLILLEAQYQRTLWGRDSSLHGAGSCGLRSEPQAAGRTSGRGNMRKPHGK